MSHTEIWCEYVISCISSSKLEMMLLGCMINTKDIMIIIISFDIIWYTYPSCCRRNANPAFLMIFFFATEMLCDVASLKHFTVRCHEGATPAKLDGFIRCWISAKWWVYGLVWSVPNNSDRRYNWVHFFASQFSTLFNFSGQFLRTIITLQALKFKLNYLNQTWLSLKSIMQLTKTIFPDSASFTKKKWLEHWMWRKSAFLWRKRNKPCICDSFKHPLHLSVTVWE